MKDEDEDDNIEVVKVEEFGNLIPSPKTYSKEKMWKRENEKVCERKVGESF